MSNFSTKTAWAVGSAAIPVAGWILSSQGMKIPIFLIWPGLILCLVMFGISIYGFALSGIYQATRRGYKMLPLIITMICFIGLIGSLIWLLIDRNIVNFSDFQKESTELSGLSNTQLRVRGLEVARSLRKMERNRPNISDSFLPFEAHDSEEQKTAKFWERARQIERIQKDYESDFWDNYRPDILVLRKEMRLRLADKNLYKSDDQFYIRRGSIGAPDRILDFRSLAGAEPLADLADMMENMARALP